jgi:hypothetical protein
MGLLTRTDAEMRYKHPNQGVGWRSRRVIRALLMFFYCLGILLLLDLIYSNFIYCESCESAKPARIRNALYNHDFAKNFSGYQEWGSPYRLYTNSLGFKDGSTRTVPLVQDQRRVLLMGDSFTEGIGVPFDQTFAGLLYRAGLESAKKIEFLNAAVAGYSPIIYYKKIKYLLESGLHFDEVVVFPDLSDIADEATNYFCIDDDPRYKHYCGSEPMVPAPVPAGPTNFLKRNFIVSERIRQMIKHAIQKSPHPMPDHPERTVDWTFTDFKKPLLPLGVEGGIARNLENMQKLADLLAKQNIPLTIAIYPWPNVLFYDDRDSRQIAIWRAFCVKNCKEFINLFPAFFSEKDAHTDWYDRLFIYGDVHFSVKGHRLMFQELAKRLL